MSLLRIHEPNENSVGKSNKVETKRLTDILILWQKIMFQKNDDFSMKFPYGLCNIILWNIISGEF